MILTGITYLIVIILLVVTAVVDLQTLRIPNSLIIAFSVLWVVWRVLLGLGNVIIGADFLTGFLEPSPINGVSFADDIIGAILLGGGVLIVTVIYEAITKKRAMGGGDIKLLAIMGLYLGAVRGIICLLIACVVGLLLALIIPRARWGSTSMVTESGSEQRILSGVPFGPSIAIGAAISLFIF